MLYFSEWYIRSVLVKRKTVSGIFTPLNYLLLSHFTDSIDESWGKWTYNYAHLSYINTASWHLPWTLSCLLFVCFNWKLMVSALPRQQQQRRWVASCAQTDTSGIVCPVWPWKSGGRKEEKAVEGKKKHIKKNRGKGWMVSVGAKGGKIVIVAALRPGREKRQLGLGNWRWCQNAKLRELCLSKKAEKARRFFSGLPLCWWSQRTLCDPIIIWTQAWNWMKVKGRNCTYVGECVQRCWS